MGLPEAAFLRLAHHEGKVGQSIMCTSGFSETFFPDVYCLQWNVPSTRGTFQSTLGAFFEDPGN